MTIANKTAFVLVGVLIIFTTLLYGAVHQPVIALTYVLIAAMMVLWAVDCLKIGELRISGDYVQLPLIGAAVYAFLQAISFGASSDAALAGIPRTISLDPFATQLSAIHFAALSIFLGVLLVVLDSASRLRRLVIVMTVFGFGYAFFAILQSVLSPDKIYGIYERPFASPFGSFVSRNNFAAWIELAAAVPLGLLFTGTIGKDKRLLIVTAVGLMGIALVVSGSRGGLVAFIAEIIFLLFLTFMTRRGNTALKVALAGLLLLAVIGGSFFVGGESSLSRLSETEAATELTTNRSHIWSVTGKVIAEHMPFGTGFGAFGAAYSRFDNNSGLERVEQAHNDYLQVLADAGLVGLILGLAFLFLLFRTGYAAVRTGNDYRRGLAIGAAAGIFAVLVHSIFDFVLHTTAISLMFLTLIAVLAASRRRFDDDVPNAEAHPPRRRSRASVTPISKLQKPDR